MQAMIERIVIEGYRLFSKLDLQPNRGMNIVVGDNESGKSTLLEAIALALTGKINGRWAGEELNPYWFHQQTVREYFASCREGATGVPPSLLIELHLSDETDALQRLRGVHNSHQTDCPGVSLRVSPAEEYRSDLAEYMEGNPPTVLPVEFYEVDWRDFADNRLHRRPRELATSYIDARTVRSTSGVDYHTREMLSEHLDPSERVQISLAHRQARQQITEKTLSPINKRIEEDSKALHYNPIGLQMDQSARTSWETGIVPQVQGIPFAMSGQGQQAAIKMSLAMSRTTDACTFVLIEEPENHLSYPSLWRLIDRIEKLAGAAQQLFVCTHSSYVANRLGVDRLLLLHDGVPAKISGLQQSTVDYFRKLAGYDTLRLVLADRAVLVEGPSDVMIFERAYRDATGGTPSADGIDVISMGGLTFKRALELCAAIERGATVLQDNDGRPATDIRAGMKDLLKDGHRELFAGEPSGGETLEPQLLAANGEDVLREILKLEEGADVERWMSRNKTEAALRIHDWEGKVTMPAYITEAVGSLV
jgi:energy-coupling factor transporter ATP-binding protein EcfA2